MKKMINILLFSYGVSIGLPDTALNFLSTRLRLDDGIMMILFLCLFIYGLYRPYRFTKSQLKFLKIASLFAVFCLLSLCVTLILDLPFNSYPLFRMLGCMLIVITLVTVLKSSKTIKWLGWGLAFGGGLIIVQIIISLYQTVGITSMTHSFQLKNALCFQTWNANASGNYAVMFAFIMALISYEMSGIKKRVFWLMAGVFSLIPLFIFARGATAGIGTAWLVFILLARQNRPAKAFVVLLFVGMIMYLSIYESKLIYSAFHINVSTGEGLSRHDTMWHTALDLIAKSPLIGHGFGQETRLFRMRLSGVGMAHNAFLSVFVEGGLIGLLLFIWPLGYLGCRLWRFAHGRFYDTPAVVCFAFLLGILVSDLSQSTLYWHKSQMLILSLIVVYLGKAEKSVLCKAI